VCLSGVSLASSESRPSSFVVLLLRGRASGGVGTQQSPCPVIGITLTHGHCGTGESGNAIRKRKKQAWKSLPDPGCGAGCADERW
jgi:hypothetical protein